MNRLAVLASLFATACIIPAEAQAHLVNSGLGPFYDGALHLLMSPGDLLGLAATALLAGLRGRAASRLTVIALPISWLFGGVIGMNLSDMPDLAWLSVVSIMVPGLLLVADARLPPHGIAVLGGAYGMLHGLVNGAVLVAVGAGTATMIGIVLTVSLTVLLISASVIPLHRFWARVAVRVAGSWIVAVSMLMLGWLTQDVS